MQQYEIEYHYTKDGVGSTDYNGVIRFEAKNDKAAKKKFTKIKKDPQYQWDYLDLKRIDQEEKTTTIASK